MRIDWRGRWVVIANFKKMCQKRWSCENRHLVRRKLNNRPPNNHKCIWKPTHLEDRANLHHQGHLSHPGQERRCHHVHLLGPADTQCNETSLHKWWRQVTEPCEIRGPRGGDHEDYGFMGCDTVKFCTLVDVDWGRGYRATTPLHLGL
jgi:hypothetical protein